MNTETATKKKTNTKKTRKIDVTTCKNCKAKIVLVPNTSLSLEELQKERVCATCHCMFNSQVEYNEHNYSFKPRPNFHMTESEREKAKQDLRFFGVELEIERNQELYDGEKNHKGLNGISIFNILYLKHDGSLRDGTEVVTHPFTLDFAQEQRFFQIICPFLARHRFLSHETETCGLHIHVNRNSLGLTTKSQNKTIATLMLLFERFEKNLLKFSRRDPDRLNQWARISKLRAVCYQKGIKDSVEKDAREERRQAINLKNTETIEFRLFKGTLKSSTVLASIQLVDYMCGYARRFDINKIGSLQWTDLFKNLHKKKRYTELYNYLCHENLYKNTGLLNIMSSSKPIFYETPLRQLKYTPRKRDYVIDSSEMYKWIGDLTASEKRNYVDIYKQFESQYFIESYWIPTLQYDVIQELIRVRRKKGCKVPPAVPRKNVYPWELNEKEARLTNDQLRIYQFKTENFNGMYWGNRQEKINKLSSLIDEILKLKPKKKVKVKEVVLTNRQLKEVERRLHRYTDRYVNQESLTSEMFEQLQAKIIDGIKMEVSGVVISEGSFSSNSPISPEVIDEIEADRFTDALHVRPEVRTLRRFNIINEVGILGGLPSARWRRYEGIGASDTFHLTPEMLTIRDPHVEDTRAAGTVRIADHVPDPAWVEWHARMTSRMGSNDTRGAVTYLPEDTPLLTATEAMRLEIHEIESAQQRQAEISEDNLPF